MMRVDSNVLQVSDLSSQFVERECSPGSVNETLMYGDSSMLPTFLDDDIHQLLAGNGHFVWILGTCYVSEEAKLQVEDHSDKQNVGMEQKDDALNQKRTIEFNAEKKKRMDRAMGTKNQKKEERI